MGLWQEMKRSKIMDLSAQLAFYFLLMFVPFLLFLVVVVGYLPIQTDYVVEMISNYVPKTNQHMVENILVELLNKKKGALWLIIVLSVVSTSNGVHATIRALNEAYRVKETRSYWRVRGLSILFTILMMLAILVQLMIPTLGRSILEVVHYYTSLSTDFLNSFDVIKWFIGFGTTFFVIIGLYCYTPNHELTMKRVWIGALFASLGWQVFSLGFAWYLKHFNQFNVMYGSLGAVIILMLWFYCIGFILLLGGEINALISRRKKRMV